MFTDIVGYSTLTQRNEALALQLLEEHRRLLRPSFSRYGGKEIKTIGDAFLVEFSSAVEATRCAIEIQKALEGLFEGVPPEGRIQVRIGLHVGDVVYQDGDVLGDGVNIASRIQRIAEPGGISLSEDVARQIRSKKIDCIIKYTGQTVLKNVETPVGIYQIVLPWKQDSESCATLRNAVRSRTALKRIRSLAVLPFANLNCDPDLESFADAMTEELLTELSQTSGVRVISRTSVMGYKGTRQHLPEIARDLSVDVIVEGSIHQAGGRIRITAQLIQAVPEQHLWAKSYERNLSGDILDLQSGVARAIADEIKAQGAFGRRAPSTIAEPANPPTAEDLLPIEGAILPSPDSQGSEVLLAIGAAGKRTRSITSRLALTLADHLCLFAPTPSGPVLGLAAGPANTSAMREPEPAELSATELMST